jgi:hypothetical protein
VRALPLNAALAKKHTAALQKVIKQIVPGENLYCAETVSYIFIRKTQEHECNASPGNSPAPGGLILYPAC